MLTRQSLELFREQFVSILTKEITRALKISISSISFIPIVSVHCHNSEFADFIRQILLENYVEYTGGKYYFIYVFTI